MAYHFPDGAVVGGNVVPTLLVVDDEPDNVDLLTRRLSRRGYEVLGATGALAGIALAREKRPAVVLMDIKMPEVDGHQAIASLKSDPETQDIPIIALTAHAMNEDRDKALAAGADEYESKPVDFARLLDKIASLIAGSST